jgi:hypothetical protein
MERSGLAARETQSFLLGHFLASYSGHPKGLLATFRLQMIATYQPLSRT